MFSSNPFPFLPSSTDVFPPPNSFFHYEKDDFHFINYHHRNNVDDDPIISGEHIFHAENNTTTLPPPAMEETVTIIKQDFVRQQQFFEGLGLQDSEHDADLLGSVISRHKKKIGTSKKHGHSKICTARGPRDRRVRFSIEVAQKFFSLQDLLGFDKASKTLDWLITNSLPAIKELVEETGDCSSSTVTHDQLKLKFLEAINGGSDDTNGKQKKLVPKSCVAGKKIKKTWRKCESGFQVNNNNGAKEQSRAEARARARERTREKMRVKKLEDDGLKGVVHDGCEYCQVSPSNLTLKSDCWNEIEPQINDYKSIRWKCIMGPETSKQSKDSSFNNI